MIEGFLQVEVYLKRDEVITEDAILNQLLTSASVTHVTAFIKKKDISSFTEWMDSENDLTYTAVYTISNVYYVAMVIEDFVELYNATN